MTSDHILQLDGRNIGRRTKPYIIAEVSGNHNQSLERALAIVDAVAASGAEALKLQTYTPETMTLDTKQNEFFIDDPTSPWSGMSLFELYGKAHTPWEWHEPIFRRCREHGLTVFSTAYDRTSVDFLESLNTPFYKVASFENTDIPLIRRIAETGKPIIMSTGLCDLAALAESVVEIRKYHNKLVLLKCTSSYPTHPSASNLATIPHMESLFSCPVGLSDHTPGIGVAVAGAALGACVIEKHVTLSRADGGVDAGFSIEPLELRQLVVETERAWQSIGKNAQGPVSGFGT